MDLSRAVYSRDLKIAAMRALDAGSTGGEIARKYQLSPKLLERWRGEWRAKGELAFSGIGRRGVDLPALDEARRIAELERKIGQFTLENDFLKNHKRRHCSILLYGFSQLLRTASGEFSSRGADLFTFLAVPLPD